MTPAVVVVTSDKKSNGINRLLVSCECEFHVHGCGSKHIHIYTIAIYISDFVGNLSRVITLKNKVSYIEHRDGSSLFSVCARRRILDLQRFNGYS